MKYDVFISYSRKDTKTADRICDALSKSGVTCFIDRKDIDGGKEFTEVIMDAIDNSALFLFIGSNNSYSAKYAPLEAKYAFDEKESNTIIPYLIDDTPLPKKFRFYFGTINIRNIKEHPIETILVKDVLNLLGREVSDVKAREVPPTFKGRNNRFKSLRLSSLDWKKMLGSTRGYINNLLKEKHPVIILLYILQVVAIIAMLVMSFRLFSNGYVSKPFDFFLNRGITWWWNLLFATSATGLLFATMQMFRNKKIAFYAIGILDIIVAVSLAYICIRTFGVAQGSPRTYGKGAETLYANLRYVGYVFSSHGLKPMEVLEKVLFYLIMPVHMLIMWAGLHIKKNGKSAWSLMK